MELELAGQAAARAPGARGRAARRQQARCARRARARDEQSRSRAGRARRRVSRGPVLPPERVSAAHRRRCASDRGDIGARRSASLRHALAHAARRCRLRRWLDSWPMRGPATCASSRTSCSARCCFADGAAAHRARAPRARPTARGSLPHADRARPGSRASSGKRRRAASSRRSKRIGGVRRQAAEQLGISDRTLRYKLSKMRARRHSGARRSRRDRGGARDERRGDDAAARRRCSGSRRPRSRGRPRPRASRAGFAELLKSSIDAVNEAQSVGHRHGRRARARRQVRRRCPRS